MCELDEESNERRRKLAEDKSAAAIGQRSYEPPNQAL